MKKKCPQCDKNREYFEGKVCTHCWYANAYDRTMQADPDDRDWEWSVCEDCGSYLSSDGLCHNTSCGNSPFQGEDWE